MDLTPETRLTKVQKKDKRRAERAAAADELQPLDLEAAVDGLDLEGSLTPRSRGERGRRGGARGRGKQHEKEEERQAETVATADEQRLLDLEVALDGLAPESRLGGLLAWLEK